MRRRNRKWVAAAVVLYLLVMWSAYRWGDSLRVPGGNIFVRLEREGIRRQQEEAAKAAKEKAAQATTPLTSEARLNAAGPAYVGARYDGEVFGTQDGGDSWQSMNLPHGVKDIYSLACG